MNSVGKCIYRFGKDAIEGNGSMRELLGGKGAGLAEMTRLGVPVPPGFTLATSVCRYWLDQKTYPKGLQREMDDAVRWLEIEAGSRLGDPIEPLLLSVRSGAPISMPGMMDTILNIGLNDECVLGLAERSGSMRFALDSYRRLIQMFSIVVLEVSKHRFDRALDEIRRSEKIAEDSALSVDALETIVRSFKSIVLEVTGNPFPQDPHEQLRLAIDAVFNSWNSPRAKCYRKLEGISESLGTAVTVQTMVFGNRGEDSGTGVGFTRNPSTGEPNIFGEFLFNAQGEDIVAGTRTPVAIVELSKRMPELFEELVSVTTTLERHYRDVQEFEFTIEDGKLFLLQTRSAKRSALAAVRTSVDMASEGLITRSEALLRVKPASLTEMLAPQLDFPNGDFQSLTTGFAASPGAAVGLIAFSANEAVVMAAAGKTVILVTEETTADDIHGMAVATGFLTARGGATSHAAVVARGLGKCCITGAKDISHDLTSGTARIGSETFHSGDWLSLDGSTGRVFAGRLPLKAAVGTNHYLQTLLDWAIEESSIEVWANADTPNDAARARTGNAAGIGLCRTEHMFFDPRRLNHMRAMILANNELDRSTALDALLPMQQHDFEELFRSMSPLPVTIRLLDPPLHEFLPSVEEVTSEIAAARREENWDAAIQLETVRRRIETMRESNPMMGHRGCRLSLTYPDILRMQVRAILQAALVTAGEGFAPVPEIMVPLISSEEEMKVLAEAIHETASSLFAERQQTVPYSVGAMIELPRAAICAGRIAKHISFLSFGTNDLTQMTYGFSRDDSRSYLDEYLKQEIFAADPFTTIDEEGVGSLMKFAIAAARETNPGIKIGVCGEHGGDPESIRFFSSLGVDYVSCSTARLPVAQLSAGHATLRSEALSPVCLECSTVPPETGSMANVERLEEMSQPV
jgi:pyruvate,orthophosphate dikinase